MAKSEKTSGKAALKASKSLQPTTATKSAKSGAGGAPTQSPRKGNWSFPVKSFSVQGSSLTKAERVAAVRTVAGSVLRQTSSKKK
jgi:hypothetical protein